MNLILTSDFPSTENPVVSERIIGFDYLENFDIDLEADEGQLSQLDRYDVIYLSGGNPIRFHTNITRTGLAVHFQRCY